MVEVNELLARISNNDEIAFMTFFDLYYKKVYLFIFKFIKEKTESEDLAQIVFIKIWEKRIYLQEVKSINGYVFSIAHRIVIDHYRLSKTKNNNLTSNLPYDETSATTLTSEDLLRKHEFETIYNHALDSLPPKRKEIFILSRHEGLTNKQIADKMCISVKTVENQMTSALYFLKDCFKQSDFFLFIFFCIFYS
jgi:RNA polymerase sigma-70 factor (ECF subfamily)